MIPTENEYTLATHAAAKSVYERTPISTELGPWDDLAMELKRRWLEMVLPIVDAALSAIPDRLDPIRAILDDCDTSAEVVESLNHLLGRS